MQSDVLIIGGGPAGIATAIAARLKGLSVTVIDARTPPIDKACGEGLLPEAVSALRQFGIDPACGFAHSFSGFRFADEDSSACAHFTAGEAYGIRRTVFHCLLVGRALDLGVSFRWGTRLMKLDSCCVHTSEGIMAYQWLVGADGQTSSVRRFAGLDGRRPAKFRFGFRRHYEIAPWTDCVEVHWGEKSQMVVAPTGAEEICVSLFTNDPRTRLHYDLDRFPRVARRIAGARPSSSEAGTMTLLSCARAVTRENIALVGDASCTVDGIAGQGLSLALRQALHLADAIALGDLGHYAKMHRRITRTPTRITRLLLAMNANPALRRKILRILAAKPAIFAKVLSIHAGHTSLNVTEAAGILATGWRAIWA